MEVPQIYYYKNICGKNYLIFDMSPEDAMFKLLAHIKESGKRKIPGVWTSEKDGYWTSPAILQEAAIKCKPVCFPSSMPIPDMFMLVNS
jgi:hypothetical protein